MSATRMVDAYCDRCLEARSHWMPAGDPGSCVCTVCGHIQLMYQPVQA